MTVKHMAAPCGSCPFTRASKPGELGGSPVDIYIGQAYGPFVLPCHCACNFDDPNWKDKSLDTPQCAGAAIFRANIGVAPNLPDAIHALPADRERVFSNEEELVAHHVGISYGRAAALLTQTPPATLLRRELRKFQEMQAENPNPNRIKPV
jgi:hypothetical protein